MGKTLARARTLGRLYVSACAESRSLDALLPGEATFLALGHGCSGADSAALEATLATDGAL